MKLHGHILTHTTLETKDGWTRMVYHRTCVAEYNPFLRVVRLNSGGWRTVTTKHRINQFFRTFDIPYSLYQSKGDWFISNPKHTRLDDKFMILEFKDNMEFNY